MLTPEGIIDMGEIILAYASIICFIAGVIGHVLMILIYITTKTFRTHQCTIYAIVESVANIGQLTTILTSYGYPIIYTKDSINFSLFWCKARAVLYPIFILVSMSMICFAAFDQFLSTSPFLYLRRKSTIKLAKTLTYTATCIWILHAILFGYYAEIQSSQGCSIYNSVMVQYLTTFYFPILCSLLPVFVSATFGILAFRNVRRIVRRQIPIVRRRLDRQLTAMVLIRVISLVILTTPCFVQRTYWYELGSKRSDRYQIAIDSFIGSVLSVLLNINYAISFYIFIILSPRYRRQVKHFLKKKCRQRFKSLSNVLVILRTMNQVAPAEVFSTVSTDSLRH